MSCDPEWDLGKGTLDRWAPQHQKQTVLASGPQRDPYWHEGHSQLSFKYCFLATAPILSPLHLIVSGILVTFTSPPPKYLTETWKRRFILFGTMASELQSVVGEPLNSSVQQRIAHDRIDQEAEPRAGYKLQRPALGPDPLPLTSDHQWEVPQPANIALAGCANISVQSRSLGAEHISDLSYITLKSNPCQFTSLANCVKCTISR